MNEGSYSLPASAKRSQPILRRSAEQAEGAEAEQKKEKDDEEQGEEEEEEEGKAAVSLDADSASPPFDGVVSLQAQHYQYISGATHMPAVQFLLSLANLVLLLVI